MQHLLTPAPNIEELPPHLHAYWISGGEITERPAIFNENLSNIEPSITQIKAIFSLHDSNEILEKNLRCLLDLCSDDSMLAELKQLKMGKSYTTQLFKTPDTPKGMVEARCVSTHSYQTKTHQFHFEMHFQVAKLAQSRSSPEHDQNFLNILNLLTEKKLLDNSIKASATPHHQPTSKI